MSGVVVKVAYCPFPCSLFTDLTTLVSYVPCALCMCLIVLVLLKLNGSREMVSGLFAQDAGQ